MKIHFFLLTSVVLLSACSSQQADQPQTQILSELGEVYPTYKSENGVLNILPLKLSISHPTSLSTAPTYGQSFDVTGTGTQAFTIHRISYDRPSDGLENWMISTDLVQQLSADDACRILGHPVTVGVRLPIQNHHLMQCAVFTNSDGDRIIAAVGFSQTFESPDHPGSMLLALRKNDALVFSDVVPFPEFNNWLQSEVSSFEHQHPNDLLWPPTTPIAKEFYTRASEYVEKMIEQPSEEVAKNMNKLEAWVNRITLD